MGNLANEMGSEERMLEEVERVLNDPEVPMHAARIWQLLAQISGESGPRSGAS